MDIKDFLYHYFCHFHKFNYFNFNIMKISLNSDLQQFHQYQQNEQSPSLTEHQQRLWHMMLEIQVLYYWDINTYKLAL